jgi:hypothetical protein
MASITGPRIFDRETVQGIDYKTARVLKRELFYGVPLGFMAPVHSRLRRAVKEKVAEDVRNRSLHIYEVRFQGGHRDVGALDFSLNGKRVYFTDRKNPDRRRIDEIDLYTDDGKLVATLKAWGTIILHSPYSVINLRQPHFNIGDIELTKDGMKSCEHSWRIVDRHGIVRMGVYQHRFRCLREILWTITIDSTNVNEDFERKLIAVFVADYLYDILVDNRTGSLYMPKCI